MEKRRRRDLSRSQTHMHANDKMNETCQTCRRREKLKGQKIKTKLSSEMKQRTATAKTDIIKFATEKKTTHGECNENFVGAASSCWGCCQLRLVFLQYFLFFCCFTFLFRFYIVCGCSFCRYTLHFCIDVVYKKKVEYNNTLCCIHRAAAATEDTIFFSSDTNFTAAAE